MFIPKRRQFQPWLLTPDGAPPAARPNICSGGVCDAITSVVPGLPPRSWRRLFPPALPIVRVAGEGVAKHEPFGQIAEGLGVDAAGAALGGQFGDLGGACFFGGGGTPLRRGGEQCGRRSRRGAW